jgi:uncharacterized protein YndB with AHSA1/START domain
VPATIPTITLTRTIDAPAIEVFRAWTDAALIERWLAPQPCVVREATVDPRPGGRYSIIVEEPNGNVHTTTGEYREVVPGRRLVKTWAYDGPYGRDETPSLLTVDFREVRPGVTELTLTHQQLRDTAASEGVGAGWRLCLNNLAALFPAPAPDADGGRPEDSPE